MPTEKKIRIPLWIYPKTKEMIEEMFPNDNCKSASEFIENAINFYAGYLKQQGNVNYLAPIITDSVNGIVLGSERRLNRNLFKIAVEFGKLSHMMAASYMLHETIEFSSNNKDYILRLWKGDYWNLQSGAEMGLYVASDKPEISGDSGIPHYEVVDFTLPMTLDLYTFENNSISTILKWHPVVDQWWITGFCHTHTYSNPKDMTMITSINFANKFEDSTGKYIEAEKLYEDFLKAKIDNEIDSKGKYDLIFDDENLTVWIVFDEGAL